MRPTFGIATSLLSILLCSSSVSARMSLRSLWNRPADDSIASPHFASFELDTANATFELDKRADPKYIFMHHIVGNTYSYTQSTWQSDLASMQSYGVDAVALNIGSDSWQPQQLVNAYAAAQAVGSIKLFISFDYSSFACSVDGTVNLVKQFANHPNQFKINGSPFISSFLGGCLGNSGWASIKSQTNGYLMPFIEGLEGKFDQWPSLDSWLCWGCAWPQGNYAKNTGDDDYYYSQLGSRFSTTVSPWFYAHYSYKNLYYRGDDWLINSRWEQLFNMRDRLTFIEMATWNDWGESHYMGAIRTADQPAGTNWVNGFPHTAWMDMSVYYMNAFRSGAYPAVTSDIIYFWARPHPAAATASNDGLGKPTGWDWTTDTMWAAVFSTGPATVTLRCGSSSVTTTIGAGVTKLSAPLAAGQMTVTMVRNGQTIINYTPTDYTYTLNPTTYNFNAWVGSARSVVTTPTSAVSSSVAGTSTSRSSSSSGSSTSTSSSAASTATGFTYVSCIAEASGGRALTGASYQSNSMTTESCQSFCSAYNYAGTEYGTQCYCGNSLSNGASTNPASGCTTACRGNSAQTCGGAYRLSLYYQANLPATSSSAASTSVSTSRSSSALSSTSTSRSSTVSTSTSTSSSAAPTSTARGFSAVGCVNEPSGGRALTSAYYSTTNMTLEYCQSLCSGYHYAGAEYGKECYCGDTLSNGATGSVVDASQCSTNCAGNAAQKCGAPYKLSLFYQANIGSAAPSASTSSAVSTTSSTTTTSSAAATSSARTWRDVGCIRDSSSRALTGALYQQSDMTPAVCRALCDQGSYTYAGTEYVNQCYCGNTLSNGATETTVSADQCSSKCAGDNTLTCGGPYRLSLYKKS